MIVKYLQLLLFPILYNNQKAVLRGISIQILLLLFLYSNLEILRPLDVVMDTEEIVISKKRHVLLPENEEENDSEKLKTKEDLKLSKKTIKSTSFSTSISSTYKPLEYETTINSDTLQNADLCLTTIPSSSNISNKNVYSPCVQATTTIEEKNMEILNNNLSKEVVNNNATVTKRKLSSICSIVNNDNANPFDYMDIDEIEEYAVKKPKKDFRESIFFPMLATSSNNENKQTNSLEPTSSCEKDKNAINLLAKAKGNGQFIDASKPFDKSVRNISLVVYCRFIMFC